MKRIFLAMITAVAAMACNNSAETDNKRDSMQQNNNTVSDSLPATHGGDTSSYEQMPNRISDSTGQ